MTDRSRVRSALRESWAQLGRTFRELAAYRQALLMLVAFLLYNDGIGTIIRMAAIYGEEMGLSRGVMIGAIVMVQFVGIPFAFLFGALAGRIGARPAIFIGLAAYAGYVRLLRWDPVLTPVILQNLPVIDARIRKVVDASVILEHTHFVGLWFQATSGVPGAPQSLVGMPAELVRQPG